MPTPITSLITPSLPLQEREETSSNWIWCCVTISPQRSIRWESIIPMPKLHHIKKENIGLIEVMGLAVLPARLKGEMAHLKEAILAGKDLRADEELAKHADWVDEFRPKYDAITAENIDGIVEKEIGLVFMQVLEDAGVYKRTEEGQKAFDRFIKCL